MIETFLKRRVIRQFLNTYSEEQWKDLIPDIFEIAVLSLQRSFNKTLFTKDELKDILEDLRDSDYYKTIQPKKIEKLTKHKTDIDSRNSTLHQHSQTEVTTKPITTKQNYPYPSWWHDEQEHALREEIEQELQHQKPHRKHKSKQHFNQNYNYHQRTSKSKPKKVFEPKLYERIPTQSETNSIYNNYTYTETDYSYDKRLVLNKLTKAQSKNQYEPKSKTTYKISYDKNLQPQSIEEKTKDIRNEGSRGSEKIDKKGSKDKMQGSLSSRNGYQYESYHERRTMSTKGDNVNNKEHSNQGSRYESRQHSNQQSRHTSQTHSLLQSQEIAPQTIPNQQQYMTRPQMQNQMQYQHPINQQYQYIEQQRLHNQNHPYMQNQPQYTNESQTHQYIQSEPIYEEHYDPNHHVNNQQMHYQHPQNEKQYEQMYQNTNQQHMNHHYLNKQSSSSQDKQIQPIITDGQDIEEASQHNKSIRKQTSQSEIQESQSIKQHQIIQSQEELPLETKELIIEETNTKTEKQTYEINKPPKPTEHIQSIHKSQLQQSNSSEARQPGEQLSMIEVNDDLRNLFKNQLSNAYISRKSGSSEENKQNEEHIQTKTQNNVPYNLNNKDYE